MKKEVKLGNEVQCIVSGFRGIASSKVEYLNGCVQFFVRPPTGKDKKMAEGHYIDLEQLKVVGKGVYVEPKRTGGPESDAPGGYGLAEK